MAYQCVVCSKHYKRIEHLQRHLLSHSGVRPFRCAHCCTYFGRDDVLKRHQRTCRAAASSLPKPLSKRWACERCVLQKRACDFGRPCKTCENGGYTCSRSSNGSKTSGQADQHPRLSSPTRTNNTNSSIESDVVPIQTPPSWLSPGDSGMSFTDPHADWSFTDFIDPSLLEASSLDWNGVFNLTPTTTSPPFCEGLFSFYFLVNFTKTHSANGLVNSFDCGSSAERTEVLAYATGLKPLLAGADMPLSLVETSNDANIPTSTGPIGLGQSLPLSDPLTVKTLSILNRIKEVTTVKPRNSAVTLAWSTELERMSLSFFSPSNLRKYLELYWAIWHPNVNILHKPSFEPTRSKSILLAAMAIIGACVSPLSSDNEAAKTFFDCVEEMTFCDDALCAHLKSEDFDANTTGKQKVQALQAAYMVCLFQNWEGSDIGKRRIRRYRYSTLIAVARDIGIQNARQYGLRQQRPGDFDWQAFVTREELIRCFLWIFLLDTAFVIFNNHPPRIMAKEMRMAMASPEDCFQAETAEQCYNNIQKWLSSKAPALDSSLYSLTKTFCNSNLGPRDYGELAGLGFLNLFVIVSGITSGPRKSEVDTLTANFCKALHSLIFQYQNSLSGESQLSPIRNSLENWKATWILLSERQPFASGDQSGSIQTMWRRVGFSRYASEYWLLASLILGRISESGRESSVNFKDSHGNQPIPEQDEPATKDDILEKYDETSMQQVNELIRDLQKVDIT